MPNGREEERLNCWTEGCSFITYPRNHEKHRQQKGVSRFEFTNLITILLLLSGRIRGIRKPNTVYWALTWSEISGKCQI
jgi:hypothetical protein